MSEFQYKLFLARMGVGGPAGLGALLAWIELFWEPIRPLFALGLIGGNSKSLISR